MADDVFQTQFPIACTQRGAAYIEARDKILALDAAPRAQAVSGLQQAKADPSDWQRQLTAEILLGWLTDTGTFRQCDAFVRGELPGPAPLPGFKVSHRAEAIAELGEAVVPRVLERLWKTGEHADGAERAALFGALQKLEDRRAVMPMIALLEDKASSGDVQSSAASVLSVIGDPRGLEPVLRLAQDRTAAADARVPAIRCLGRFHDPRASDALVAVLRRDDLPLEERQAAADGLRSRSDAATRPAVVDVLQKAEDRVIRITLIKTLGDIGTAADIPPLQKLAAGNPQLKVDVDDAVEDIQTRERAPQPSP